MAFDITQALRGVSAADTGEHLEQVELHMIDESPKNFYSMDGLEHLAANIGTVGLLEPLRARRTEYGRYMLISGHRRRAAMRMLADDPDYPEWDMHRKVPVIVEADAQAVPGIEDPEQAEKARELLEELKIVFANAGTRNMTSADTAKQVRNITRLLCELKMLGYPLKGKIRDHVSEITKVSQTRIARLKVIEQKLTAPLLFTAWKKGVLGETAAYECARYDADVQACLTEPEVNALTGMTVEQVQAFMESKKAEAEELRELKANMDRAMLPFREELKRMNEEEAEAAAPAPAKDEPAKVSAADTRDGTQSELEKYLQRRHQEDDRFFELLCKVAPMFFEELGAVNSRQEGIERLKDRFGRIHHSGNSYGPDHQCSPKGLQLRRAICDKPILRTWTEVYDLLSTIALNDAAIAVQEKDRKVSAKDTGPKWETGDPKEIGEYVVVAGYSAEESETTSMKTIKFWTGSDWADGRTQVPFRVTVYRWIRLPEV